jgi:hypothetical protein
VRASSSRISFTYLPPAGARGVASELQYSYSPCENRAPVNHLLKTHLPTHVFLPIVTRDTPSLLPKPDPAGILHIAQEWGLENRAESLIMVRGIRVYAPLQSFVVWKRTYAKASL